MRAVLLLGVAQGFQLKPRSLSHTLCRSTTTVDESVAAAPRCPLNAEAQLIAARDAIARAAADGITRQQIRTLLRRAAARAPSGRIKRASRHRRGRDACVSLESASSDRASARVLVCE